MGQGLKEALGVMGGLIPTLILNNVKAVALKDWTRLQCFGRQ